MNKRKFLVVLCATVCIGAASNAAVAGGLIEIGFTETTFSTPLRLDNPYWPLLPGAATTTFIYLGETEDGCVFNKITADPSDIKTFMDSEPGYEYYDGVVARVILDREWELEDIECDDVRDAIDNNAAWEPLEGLGERTEDWYIQDDNQNIWYMGEASRDFGAVEIDGVEVDCPSLDDVPPGSPVDDWPSEALFLECTSGSWEAGQLGQEEGEVVGEAGIVVPGDEPIDGELLEPGNTLQQEVAEGAEDMVKIKRIGASLEVEDGVAPGDYENCRKTKEWNPNEPGSSVEHKWYCADGPGLVLIEGIGGGPTEQEVLYFVSP